jgi:TetR/AcrR family transcriptional regulator, mexCD-oprJ operon repressor
MAKSSHTARGAPRSPRADARRNIEAILDAARRCLASDPNATVAQIAEHAGVGRVTLYGHFPTRADLVDAVFRRVSEDADAALEGIDTSGDAVEALTRLVAATWQLVHPTSAVLTAAERELPPERLRGHHDAHLARVQSLVSRGRRDGVFRTDLPEGWLVTTAYAVMHAAAAETQAGRLDADTAGQAVVKTLVAALTVPPAG